jgi:Tol biopolymer transport system component
MPVDPIRAWRSLSAVSWSGRGCVLVASLLFASLAILLATASVASAATPVYRGASDDGEFVFFETEEKLIPADTDSRTDVYSRSFDPTVGADGAYVTREVSTGPTGGNDAHDVSFHAISSDGSKAFFSTSEALVAADADRSVDIYRHDRTTGTALVSRAGSSCVAGGCGNGPVNATFRDATPDGSMVFFQTSESLTAPDQDGAVDLYARNLASQPPTTILLSQADASCGAGGCVSEARNATFAGASADGSRVFFETAEILVPADGDGAGDVYVRDLTSASAETELVSGAPPGACPNGLSASECVPKFRGASADGSRAFFTSSERISSGVDTDAASDVYAWHGGAKTLVSVGPDGGNGSAPATFAGASSDGGTAFFQTSESLIGASDGDSVTDVYASNLASDPPVTTLVTPADPDCTGAGCGNGPNNATFAGASLDGDTIFFQTEESLAPADGDGVNDVYLHDLSAATTILASQADSACPAEICGSAAEATFAAASTDGANVFFTSSEPFAATDTDGARDVYMRDLAAPSTTLVSPGGICPLPEEAGCDSSFAGISDDGSHVFLRTLERLTAEDVDSELDIYERAEARTRLVSAGNSVSLGPATPVLTATNPAASGESLTPLVLGHADQNTSIKVYTTPDCSGEVVAGTAAELEGPGIQMVVLPGSITSFRATASDENGDTSGCSNTIAYQQKAVTPPPPPPGGGGPGPGGGGGGAVAVPKGSSPSAPTPTHDGIPYVTPVTRITFGPAFKTRTRRPVFRFTDASGQPGSRFICRLDRRRWKPCGSPIRLKGVRLGKHVFRVKAVNAAGVWEAAPSKRAFKLVGGR